MPAELTDASGYKGSADRLFAPQSEAEIPGILREACAAAQTITVVGAGTGLTGGGVPNSGWAISLQHLKRIEIHPGYAICGAGALLHDLQAAAVASRQFYPPDPTENSASIGGTIATNASGSRSFLYGDTRRHVRALRVVLASGEVLTLRRGEKPSFDLPVLPAPATTKNTAGYYLRPGMDYLDLFIGSEGTLGVVTEAELNLLPAPQSLFAGVVFFESDADSLDAVDRWRAVPQLRMLEYLDAASLDLLRPAFPEIPSSARAALSIEREGDDWYPDAGMDASWFAAGQGDRERFRRFRHALPEAVNDLVRRRGLTKTGSDFAVPVPQNRAMLRFYRDTLEREFPGQYVIFGHIGDAHLHVNLLPSSEAEWARAKELMILLATHAVELGGTVSAEHGLGKSKRHFLPIQFSDAEIHTMTGVKKRLDPQWLLGPDTLFPRPGQILKRT
jgi:FAD/FMN-containing dehydrogenase